MKACSVLFAIAVAACARQSGSNEAAIEAGAGTDAEGVEAAGAVDRQGAGGDATAAGDAGPTSGADGAGDACTPPGGCACGDAGLTCTAGETCAGLGCTCLAATDMALVQRSDGTLWQYNVAGTTVVPVTNADGSMFVATRFSSSFADLACAVKGDGTAWCWNAPADLGCDGGACPTDNQEGQLGNGTTTASGVPVQVVVGDGGPLENVRDVAVGIANGETACAADASGALWCWGYGLSTQMRSVATRVPTEGAPIGDVVQAAVEFNQTCARKTDGTVWCSGLVVDGSVSPSFVQVPLPSAAIEITLNTESGVALTADGSVWTWLPDSPPAPSQVMLTSTTAPAVHVAAMDTADYAQTADGTLWSWSAGSTYAGPLYLGAADGPVDNAYAIGRSYEGRPTFIDTSGVLHLFGQNVVALVACP